MQTKSIVTAFTLKVILLTTCVAFGFTSFTKCDAQPIVGKWKRTATKIFVADETTGKQIPASVQMQQQYDKASAERGYTETLEIKSNNTYVSTVSKAGDNKPIIRAGNYSLSGNNLDMHIPLVSNEKTTVTIISINDKMMIWNLVFMGKLTEITYTKI